MNNKPLVLLIALAVVVLGYFIFTPKDNDVPKFTGDSLDVAQGEVINVNTEEGILTMERDVGDRVDVSFNSGTEVYNLYNRNDDFRNISTGSLIRAETLIREGEVMIASKVRVLDTDSSLEITSYDSDKTFTYDKGAKFSVILNDNQYPFSSLRCDPEGVVSNISDTPGANPPYYSALFKSTERGECTLINNDFSATIVVE